MTSPRPSDAGELSRVLRRAEDAALAQRKAALPLPPPLSLRDVTDGRGHIYLGDRLLTEVDYWLRDVEEVDKSVFPTGDRALGEPSDERTGSRGTFGWLCTPPPNDVLAPHVGTPLTLALQDGRALTVTVTKVLWADNYLALVLAPPA